MTDPRPQQNPRLGIVLSTVVDAPPQEFVEIAQLAEANGYLSVLVNEGRGDALACSQAIAAGTERIAVGTNIANIFFRHPFLCANTARTISDLSGGRVHLGLGMSHRGMLRSLGIDMGDGRDALRHYVKSVSEILRGEGPDTFFKAPPSEHPVSVYAAALTVESARVAGEFADGVMPFLTPRSYLPSLVDAAREAASDAGRDPAALLCAISIPTFLSDDEAEARSAARYNLAFFSMLPNYRRQFRRAGFKSAMDAVKKVWDQKGNRRDATKEIPDELIDEVCVYGNKEQCLAQLEAFREAGAEHPILAVSPVNDKRLPATRKAIRALAPAPA